MVDLGNELAYKPEKLPANMKSMHSDIKFRRSNRSADFIKGLSEEESNDRFINHGQLLYTLFSVIEAKEDIELATQKLIFEGVIGSKETEEGVRTLIMKTFSLPEIQE